MADYQEQRWECYFPTFTKITSLTEARIHQAFEGYELGKFDLEWKYRVYDISDIERVVLYRYIQDDSGKFVDNTDPEVVSEYAPIYSWTRSSENKIPPTSYSDRLGDYEKNGLTNATVFDAVSEILETRRALFYRVEVWVNRVSSNASKLFVSCDGEVIKAFSGRTQVINNKFYSEGAKVWEGKKRLGYSDEVFLRVAIDLVYDLSNNRTPVVWASTSQGGIYCFDYYTGEPLSDDPFYEDSKVPIRAFALNGLTGDVVYDAGLQEVRKFSRGGRNSSVISTDLPSLSNNVGGVCTVENGNTFFYCISNTDTVVKIGVDVPYTKVFDRKHFGCSDKTPANQPNVFGITKGVNGAVWVNGHTPLHMSDYRLEVRYQQRWKPYSACAKIAHDTLLGPGMVGGVVAGTSGRSELDRRHSELSNNITVNGTYRCIYKTDSEHGELYDSPYNVEVGTSFHILQDIGYVYGVTDGVNSWATNGQLETDVDAVSSYQQGAKSISGANATYFRPFTSNTSARFARLSAAVDKYGWFSTASGGDPAITKDYGVYKPWANPFTSATSSIYAPNLESTPPSSQLGMCAGFSSNGKLYHPSANTFSVEDYDVYVTNMGDHAVNRLSWIGDTPQTEKDDRNVGLVYPVLSSVVTRRDVWTSEDEYDDDYVSHGIPSSSIARIPSHVTIDSNNNVWGQDVRNGLIWKIYTQPSNTNFPNGGFSTYPSTGYYYTSGSYAYGRNGNDAEVEYALLCSAAAMSTQSSVSEMDGQGLEVSAALEYLETHPDSTPETLRVYPNYLGAGKTHTFYNVLTASESEREYNSDGTGIGSLMSFGRTVLDAAYIHPAPTYPRGFMYISGASSLSNSYCDIYDGEFWDERTFIGPATAFDSTNVRNDQYVSGYDDIRTTHVLDVDMGSFVFRWGAWRYEGGGSGTSVTAFTTEHVSGEDEKKVFTDKNYHFLTPNYIGLPQEETIDGMRPYEVSGFAVSYPNVYDRVSEGATEWLIGINYADVYERWPSPKFCIDSCEVEISDGFWGKCVSGDIL